MEKPRRKESLSVGLETQNADILRIYAKTQRRSLSDTIRMILQEFIVQHKLEEQQDV